jgi:NAD(P)-dependent dehydrogenase (short-subunit alcohol dehydrogenase family)
VRRLAGEVLAAYPWLDVLVNNVGGFWATRQITPDGLERTFAVNYLAPFLLTGLLLDRLTAIAPARIVTVSSGAHATGKINFGDLQGEHRYSGPQAYMPDAAATSAAAARVRAMSRPVMPTRAPIAARPVAVARPIPPVPR